MCDYASETPLTTTKDYVSMCLNILKENYFILAIA